MNQNKTEITMNPTPTPLASTAMEAATPRSDAFFDTCACRNYSSCWEFARQLERELAAFQPLLAKVEGERDEHIRIALSCGQSTVQGLKDSLLREMHIRNQKDLPAGFDSWSAYHESIVQLRADLAAKEAALKELQKQLNACADERMELIEGIVHAISLVGTHTDAFCDQDTPEMANGSPEWESLHHLRGHLEGSLIGDDGEYLACDKFPTTTKT